MCGAVISTQLLFILTPIYEKTLKSIPTQLAIFGLGFSGDYRIEKTHAKSCSTLLKTLFVGQSFTIFFKLIINHFKPNETHALAAHNPLLKKVISPKTVDLVF